MEEEPSGRRSRPRPRPRPARPDGGDPAPAERLIAALERADERIAVAEAHTGGAVAARVVAVPGASGAFDRGWIVYGRDAPRTELGVPRETLDDHGAVSAPVARELARRARDRADATWGVATTGVAGPTGGTEATPVGTVFVGVARAAPWESGASSAAANRYSIGGDRRTVIEASTRRALADVLSAVETRRVDANADADTNTDTHTDGDTDADTED